MSNQPRRRELNFNSLAEVLREVDRLQAGGCEPLGQWNLAQICEHLADWMTFPLDGFPRPPIPVRGLMWILRHTIGRKQFRKILTTGQMRTGVPTFPETVHAPDSDPTAAIERLQQAMHRFETHTGPICPSPFFGPTDYELALRLQLVHCAHHLGFLRPV